MAKLEHGLDRPGIIAHRVEYTETTNAPGMERSQSKSDATTDIMAHGRGLIHTESIQPSDDHLGLPVD